MQPQAPATTRVFSICKGVQGNATLTHLAGRLLTDVVSGVDKSVDESADELLEQTQVDESADESLEQTQVEELQEEWLLTCICTEADMRGM